MALFRFHRGDTIYESLKNTRIVKNMSDLRQVIWEDMEPWIDNFPELTTQENFKIKIIPYIFDDRIGWHTQLVSVDIYERPTFSAIGYLSEPLDDYQPIGDIND